MAEPISLEDAKRQLRVLSTDEDAFITSAIVEARGWIENYTGLVLTRREVVDVLPCFGAELSTWPIASIEAVTYLDTDGQEVVLQETEYFAQIARRPAYLTAGNWPTVRDGSMIEVTMTAGFATPDAVSAFSPNLMRAMRVLVAGYFRDREGGKVARDAEEFAKARLRNFRRWRV